MRDEGRKRGQELFSRRAGANLRMQGELSKEAAEYLKRSAKYNHEQEAHQLAAFGDHDEGRRNRRGLHFILHPSAFILAY